MDKRLEESFREALAQRPEEDLAAIGDFVSWLGVPGGFREPPGGLQVLLEEVGPVRFSAREVEALVAQVRRQQDHSAQELPGEDLAGWAPAEPR
jgi:hypothetical protein